MYFSSWIGLVIGLDLTTMKIKNLPFWLKSPSHPLVMQSWSLQSIWVWFKMISVNIFECPLSNCYIMIMKVYFQRFFSCFATFNLHFNLYVTNDVFSMLLEQMVDCKLHFLSYDMHSSLSNFLEIVAKNLFAQIIFSSNYHIFVIIIIEFRDHLYTMQENIWPIFTLPNPTHLCLF